LASDRFPDWAVCVDGHTYQQSLLRSRARVKGLLQQGSPCSRPPPCGSGLRENCLLIRAQGSSYLCLMSPSPSV
jgi:hypothetical protein